MAIQTYRSKTSQLQKWLLFSLCSLCFFFRNKWTCMGLLLQLVKKNSCKTHISNVTLI